MIDFQLSLDPAIANSAVSRSVKSCETVVASANEHIAKAQDFSANLSNRLLEFDQVLEDVSDPLSKVHQLQQVHEYLNVIQDVDQLR